MNTLDMREAITGDHWYRWVEHGCKLKPGERIAA